MRKGLLALILATACSAQTPVPNPITQVDYPTQLKRIPGQSYGYVTAFPFSPLTIPASSHLQGQKITVDCWSGPIILNRLAGDKVLCQVDLDAGGNGDVTITASTDDVKSVVVSSVQYPYALPATTSPQVILASVHRQGQNVAVDCWSGPLAGTFQAPTGQKRFCRADLATSGNGDVTVRWSDGDVGSIMISGATLITPFVGTAKGIYSAQTHLQGPDVSVECWSGALVVNHITGTKVECQAIIDPTGNGSVTVNWGDSDVGSFMISTSGPSVSAGPPGPAGQQGPPGNQSFYFANTTSPPMTILQTTHLQGINAQLTCWDGVLSAGTVTGYQVYCSVQKDAAGNYIVDWTDGTVMSIQIIK